MAASNMMGVLILCIDFCNKKFKLPYRTYIWQGKAGKDLNGDGDIKNVAVNPTAIPPTSEYKEEGWCFAYGEEEWLAGKLFAKVRQDASDYDADGVEQTPVGRVSCQ